MRSFFTWVSILIGSFLLIIIGLGVFLMIAPGTKIFGIQYVKATSETNVSIEKKYTESVVGDLVFETYGVPITIEYHPYTSFEFNFVQKFNGFTRSKIEKPSISMNLDEETGNLIIKTEEFVPFLWGSNSAGYSLNCKVPATYKNHSVTISSEKSNIDFKSNSDAVAIIKDLVIQTKGSITLSGSINMTKLVVSGTKYELKIPNTVSMTDAKINCVNKKVSIANAVIGKLEFSSRGGSLEFYEAGELTAKTKGGSIVSTSDGLSVYRNATITTTKSGKVVLQSVGGDFSATTVKGWVIIGDNLKGSSSGVLGKVNIETTSGAVYLKGDYANDLLVFVKTSSGKVYVGDNNRSDTEKQEGALAKIEKLEVQTKTGAISIEQAAEIKVTATKGNVTIGKFTSSCSVVTTSGDVNVGGNTLGGSLYIQTGKNGNVTANKLGGSTTISSAGQVYAEFDNVFGKIDISGTSKEIKVVVPDSISISTNHIWVESEKTSAYIKLNGLEYNGKVYHSIDSIPEQENYRLIKIMSTSGAIRLTSKSYK